MREKLNRLKFFVTVLLILEILSGVVLIGLTARYHCILMVYLAKSERQALVGQLSNIYLLGFEFLVCYSVGLILWRFIWKSETITEHTKLLVAWNGFCILVVLSGSITVWFLYSSIESLQNAAATSLFQGMDMYFSDPEWKLLWDGIQYHNECCGVNGYEDWKDASWMPEEQSKCQPMPGAGFLLLVPYACCKRSVRSCFQNYIPHITAVTVPYLNASDINANGCLPKFNTLTCELFYSLAGMMLVVLFLQIILIIFGITTITKMKKTLFGSRDCPDDNGERPLVVVKYPRNVRCITLTDEDNFDDVDEDEEENCRRTYRTTTAEGISVRQEITNNCDGRENIFLH